MRRRSRTPLRLPVLVLALAGLVAAGCVDDGELGGPGLGDTVALKVGDWEYTTGDLEAEVEQWASNPVFLSQVVQITDIGVEGRRSSELVTYVLSHRVISELARQLSEDTGFQVADAAVQAVIADVDAGFPDPNTGGPLFGAYAEEFRQLIGRDFVVQENLFQAVDLNLADVPSVSVNPRYGTYQDLDRGLGQVIGPEGPRPAPTSGILEFDR